MTEEVEDRAAEIEALGAVVKALAGVGPAARTRILKYASEAYEIDVFFGAAQTAYTPQNSASETQAADSGSASSSEDQVSAELEGVNSVAIKWITRSGFDPKSLETIFSLGGDEIDLIAEEVPGEKKKERMRNVLLLLGVANYLSSGAPRITDDRLRETSQHYDAMDPSNFATNMKSFSAEVSGSKETGYTLSQRGLTAAKDLIKEMLKP
jgi:hypothetical protein